MKHLEKLRKLRIEKDYSYADMANFLEISKSYYWQLENRRRKLSYEQAIKLAKIFGLKPDDVFWEDF